MKSTAVLSLFQMYTHRALNSNLSKLLPTNTHNCTFSLDFRKLDTTFKTWKSFSRRRY